MLAASLNRNLTYPVYQTQNRNYNINNHPQISFEGDDKKRSLKSLIFPLMLASLYGGTVLQSYPITGNYTPAITQNIGWTDNVQVLASSSQRYVSRSFPEGKHEFSNKTAYNLELLENLKKGRADNLYGAHKLIEEEGLKAIERYLIERLKQNDEYKDTDIQKELNSSKIYHFIKKISKQFPVATPNDLDCWNINDKTKNRIILAIGGSDELFLKEINWFSNEITELYSVPAENIIKLPNANKKSVNKSLETLAEKIKDSDPKNTEILIYYSGHGGTTTGFIPYANHLLDEGAASGKTDVGLNEKNLKKYVKEKLKDIKTLIIMDTCHSGAWIAKNYKYQENYKVNYKS